MQKDMAGEYEKGIVEPSLGKAFVGLLLLLLIINWMNDDNDDGHTQTDRHTSPQPGSFSPSLARALV